MARGLARAYTDFAGSRAGFLLCPQLVTGGFVFPVNPKTQNIMIESEPRDLEPLAHCPKDAAELKMSISRTDVIALIKDLSMACLAF